MPASPKVRYTYADYLAIPDDTAHRYEIVDGDLFVNPTPVPRHQEVVVNLTYILTGLARAHGLGKIYTGPITVRLHDDTVVEPDVIFVSAARSDLVDPRRGVLGAPELVVEVLSPSNRGYDRHLKRKRYMSSGVAELWIVEADEEWLEVWRPGATEPQIHSAGTLEWRVGQRTFEIALTEIFWSS